MRNPFRVLALITTVVLFGAGLASTTEASGTSQLGPRAGVKPIHQVGVQPKPNTLTVRSNGSTGVVSPHPKVYLVFWGSQWSSDPAGAANALTQFFKGLHGTPDTYDTILNQYCEGVPTGTSKCGTSGIHIQKPTKNILAGVWNDNATKAPKKATMAQIAQEALNAAALFGNLTQAANLNSQYVIASPSGTHPDGFPSTGFCGWHSFTSASFGNLAYTNLPYVPDLGLGVCTTISSPNAVDGLLSTETHEYSETVTDFWPSRGWNGSGGEIGDECVSLDGRITLPTGTFDVQGEWSNSANKCGTHG